MDNNTQGQMQPPQGQPYPSQPYPPQGQPYPPQGQPYPPRPPKKPMDPAKKKKIILFSTLGGAVAALGIAAAIIIPILLRVDYATAYNTAKELKPKIYDIYQSYDCEYVVDYADSGYTSTKDYGEYINGCLEIFESGAGDLVSKLQETDGVKRNNELKTQSDKFNAEFAKITAGNTEDLKNKLEIYRAWHAFQYAIDDLSWSSSDAEYNTAANNLIQSNNESLKTYGEGWLEQTLKVAAAYRAYQAALTNWSGLYDQYKNLRSERENWVAANQPDIEAIATLNFDDLSKMYDEFSELYDMIATTYAENYNSGSGDCTEFLGEVFCD